MADENEEVEDGEGDAGAEEKGKKKKGGGGALPGLLKWVAIAVVAVILMVTIALVTVKMVAGNSTQQVVLPVTPDYAGKPEALAWYQSIGAIRTRTSDAIPASVSVEPALGYKLDDKSTPGELTQRQVDIKDFLRRFFSECTIEDLKPYNEEKLRIEIRNKINDDILTTSKIRDVKFVILDVIEQ
ncbi:MAG: flagellar basal body-associated FliL family protein [Treponemataceae bacterium]|nr:MAG: flagellar basal body-associated FliL family protein [Treponemataceae bacterium]